MKKTLWISFLFALLFIACGDNSSTSANNLNDDEVSSKFRDGVKTMSSSRSVKSSSSVALPTSSSRRSEGTIGFSSSSALSSSSAISSSSDNVFEPDNVIVGTVMDSRDGQVYKTVTIGSQTWMAENLNYNSNERLRYSACYKDSASSASNCAKYGRYYSWAVAVGKSEEACGNAHNCSLPSGSINGVCPSGWHLPSKTEWETLLTAVGGQSIAGKKLKSKFGWNNGGNGTDDFSFSALPAGYGYGPYTDGREGVWACFWSSTELSDSYAYSINLYSDSDPAAVSHYPNVQGVQNAFDAKSYMFSVRCLKNSESDTVIEPNGFMTDSRDGQRYNTIKIGEQTWMAQNLNYETENSYCYNDSASYCTKYGRLYTWSAAVGATEDSCGYGRDCSFSSGNVQGVCPAGWHLPSRFEWWDLIEFLGGSNAAEIALKYTSGWKFRSNGSDASSFSALPAGYREGGKGLGNYIFEGATTYFWSSTQSSTYKAYSSELDYYYAGARGGGYDKNSGFSVRCLKD